MDNRQSVVIQMLELIVNEDYTNARKLCKDAERENGDVLQKYDIQMSGQNTLNEVQEVIRDLKNNQKKSAKNKATRLLPAVRGVLSEASTHTLSEKRGIQQQNAQRDRQLAQQRPMEDHQEVMLQRSKEAGQAMRRNNPNIADLSDPNRPTKIAERFSQLYDDDWTDTFETLCKMTNRPDERHVINLLLRIVEEAYKFCESKAQRQIGEMTDVCEKILTFGKVTAGKRGGQANGGKQTQTESHLVEYRKENAKLSVQSLQEEFLQTVDELCKRNITQKVSSSNKAISTFSNKAIELCWYMCVQDPPVYMVPTSGIPFDPNLYRGYTKTGTRPDFIVWPALQLYNKGGLLTKGVVQYK